MEYIAFYRKYRPKKFEEIMGQETIVKILNNASKNNKISHAYLFSGPRGSGKTSLAKLFAKTLNCENKKDNNPCERCDSCLSIENSSASDIIEIDAASNNGVDEIREIKSKITLSPNVCKYKVYIIDEVHMLSIGAFNALLKTLEEPPKHIIFILATTEPQKIPETIISRCQRYDFKRVSEKSIIKRLKYISKKENIKIDNNSLSAIALASDGGLRDAIGYLEQTALLGEGEVTQKTVAEVVGTITDEEIIKIIENYQKNQFKKLVEDFEHYYSNGKNIIKIMEFVLKYLKRQYLEKEEEKTYITLVEFSMIYEKTINSTDPLIKLQTEFILKNKNNNNIDRKKNKKFETKQKNISQEIKVEKTHEKEVIKTKETKSIPEKINSKELILNFSCIDNIVKTRINNAFFCADKKILKECREKKQKIESYSIDNKYSKIVSLLSDSQIVVAGKGSLLFATEYKTTADRINKNIILAESLIKKCYKEDYKIIVITYKEWEKHKANYIKKIKNNEEYKYIEEKPIFFKTQEKPKDDIMEVFSDIIEEK